MWKWKWLVCKMLKVWKNRILKIELKINSISLNNENNEQIYCQNKKLKFEIKISADNIVWKIFDPLIFSLKSYIDHKKYIVKSDI